MILIFLFVLLLFSSSKLPELARSMGKSMGEFKRAQRETELEVQKLDAPVREAKSILQSIPQSIQKIAEELGIRTEGKDENKLLEEIKAGLKVRVEKG